MNIRAISRSYSNNCFNSLISMQKSKFSTAYGKYKLGRFKKEVMTDKSLDLSKGYYVNKQVKAQEDQAKESIFSQKKVKKLSHLIVSSKSRLLKQIGFNPFIKANKFNLLRVVKETSNMNLGYIKKSHGPNWKEMFRLDYTAQGLENLRRIKENEIFFRKLKREADIRLGIKYEGNKVSNILPNYGEFKDFEPYNNSTNILKNNTYSVIDFLPEGSTKIGKSLQEPNPIFSSKAQLLNTDYKNSKYNLYGSNGKELNNLRISNLVNNSFKSNPKLNSLLGLNEGEAKKSIEDQRKEQNVVLSQDKMPNEGSVTFIDNNSNQNQTQLNRQLELTLSMKQYELEAYERFRNLDLYGKYKTGRVSFSQLSLQEILLYIKFNVHNSKYLFGMFNELVRNKNEEKDLINMIKQTSLSLNQQVRTIIEKEKSNSIFESVNPLIIASMVQKLAFGVKSNEHRIHRSLFKTWSYKYLLQCFQHSLKHLNIKHLVDSLYSIALIHKASREFSPAFFQHLLEDCFCEINSRFETIIQSIKENKEEIPYLAELFTGSISFLAQALSHLKVLECENEVFLIEAYTRLCSNIFCLVDLSLDGKIQSPHFATGFTIFEIGHILNFFYSDFLKLSLIFADLKVSYNSNDATVPNQNQIIDLVPSQQQVHLIISKFCQPIIKYMKDEINEFHSEVEPSDIENIVKTLSYVYTAKKMEAKSQDPLILSTEDIAQLKQNISLMATMQATLKAMTPMILVKTDNFAISHASLILFCYANADVYIDDMFRKINLRVKDKLEIIDNYEVRDMAYFTAGVSKFYMREIFPDHLNEIFNHVYPIFSSVRKSHARFSTFDTITNFGAILNSLDSSPSCPPQKTKSRKKAMNYYKLIKHKREQERVETKQDLKPFSEPNNSNLYMKMNNPKAESVGYVPMTIYCMALMGYQNPVFFNTSIQSIIMQSREKGNDPDVNPIYKNLGYLMQTLALLNNNSEAKVNFLLNFVLENCEILLSLDNSELIISQILSAMVSLSSFFKITPESMPKLNMIEAYIRSKVLSSTSNSKANALALSFISIKLLSASTPNLFDSKSTESELLSRIRVKVMSKYEKVVTYLILLELSDYTVKDSGPNSVETIQSSLSSKNFKNFDFNDLIEVRQEFLKFETIRYEAMLHNAREAGYEDSLINIMQSLLRKNNCQLYIKSLNRAVHLELNHIACDSFIIPIYVREFNLAITFYDQSETLSDGNIKGFLQIQERIIEKEIKNIQRVCDEKDIRSIEDESKYTKLLAILVEKCIKQSVN